jgi:ankyrin repeat protein
VAVTKQLIAARCNVDLQAKDGATALQVAERQGHTGIATLIIRKQNRGKKDTLLQASPAQEDADRAMKELLEEEAKDAAAAAAVSQKKKQAKKAGKERPRRDAADGQDGSQMEEHTEEQKDTQRTEAKAVSEKNKTESVAAVAVAAALKDKAQERGGEE